MKTVNDQYSNAVITKKFIEFLEKYNLRKTPERLAILDCILKTGGLFTVDDLYNQMTATNFRVSRATLYNTIELLSQCEIVRRHVFEGMQPQYERVTVIPYNYLICKHCGKIKVVRDNDFVAFMNAHKKIKAFTMSHYSLYIYGICNTCARKRKRNAANKSTSK